MTFRNKLRFAFVVIIVLLVGAMVVAVQRVDALAGAEIARVRAKGAEVTIVERLRWNGELISSLGRGYLITADPNVRAAVARASVEFDQGVEKLGQAQLSPLGVELVANVQRSAGAFRRVQIETFESRERGDPPTEVLRRFEREMLPLRDDLASTLDRLAAHKESLIERFYDEAQRHRHRLVTWVYLSIGVLGLVSLGISALFGGLLDRAHGQLRDALAATRRAVESRDQVMGIVAHDLRSPLNSITMRAALIKEVADPDLSRRHADAIENVARRMASILASMLDAATIEAGRFSVSVAACDPRQLVLETVEMFEGLFVEKGVGFEHRLGGALPEVRGDRGRLLQVLSNLVGNALKFTPPGGNVSISAAREGAMVRFTVSDTGPGIARESQARLFERFWHEAKANSGTGLGLFISNGIVAAHRGRLWVESELGRCATFHFTIPTLEADVPATDIAVGHTHGELAPA